MIQTKIVKRLNHIDAQRDINEWLGSNANYKYIDSKLSESDGWTTIMVVYEVLEVGTMGFALRDW